MEAEANISCEGEKCFNSPTARLSDVDDISDIDVEDVVDKLHKTITSKPVYDEKRSIFNTTLDLAEGKPKTRPNINKHIYIYTKLILLFKPCSGIYL